MAIGENAKDMLLAVLEVAVGLLDSVVFVLMNMLNGFRKLTTAERADASLVFATSVDFDKVYIATDTPTNSIIFGIQDFFTGNPESRAFVTGNLINFDVDDVPIKRYTLMHEMTHVWQNQNVGPIYMAHAIFGQATGGYTVRPTETATQVTMTNGAYYGSSPKERQGFAEGFGAETALADANGDFMAFNPEQQSR